MKNLENGKINNDDIDKNDLIRELIEKEKELKEYKSYYPIKILPNEELISVIIISSEQEFTCSIICKNTDLFSEVEKKFYDKYPEYMESENVFLSNGIKIIRYKSLKENKIKDNDQIILCRDIDFEKQ